MKISVEASNRRRRQASDRAFTMIEIAISLAVIGFALVAIIGVLPFGMNVQKVNREETIIHQDATMFLDAVRNGARGLDDLTNYVESITNVWTQYDANRRVVGSGLNWFTPTASDSSFSPPFMLTNGMRIVGLLATPKYVFPVPKNGLFSQGFRSNYVVANVRSMSGAAVEKFPQDNPTLQGMGLRYRLIAETINYGSPVPGTLTNNNAYDAGWVNYDTYTAGSAASYAHTNYIDYLSVLTRHLHDFRLVFRWPLLPNGTVPRTGPRQAFRTTIGGDLVRTNDPTYSSTVSNLWFFRPTTYTTNSQPL